MFSEREDARENPRRVALEAHVAQCAACRRIQDDLAATFTAWRRDAASTAVPDAEREWHAVRRRIRAGDESAIAGSRPSRNWFAWLGWPLGAVAAAAVAIIVSRPQPLFPTPADGVPAFTARADFVEAPGNNASTMVFVDEKSGWLIVWASDAAD